MEGKNEAFADRTAAPALHDFHNQRRSDGVRLYLLPLNALHADGLARRRPRRGWERLSAERERGAGWRLVARAVHVVYKSGCLSAS